MDDWEGGGLIGLLEGGKFADIAIPQRGFFAQAHGFFGCGGHLPYLAVHGAHEAFVEGALELCQQGVVVACCVEDNDGFKVEAELFPRDDFEQFLERSHPAWQGHAGVAQLGHLLFAAVHIGCDDEARHTLVLPLLVYHKLRNNADGLATSLHTAFGGGGHQPRAPCPVDERMTMRGKGLAEALGGFDEGGGGLSA